MDTVPAPPTVRPRTRWRPRALARALAVAVGCLAVTLTIAPGTAPADQTIRLDRDGAPSISLIGDSTLTGVRWYADYGALTRFDLVFSAESCRRTYEQSCISQEGYRSANVIEAMRTLDGELGQVLVVMSGYNDPGDTIDEAIDGVVDEARRQGVEHVVWLTLRTSDDVVYSDPQEQSSIETFRRYNEQLVAAADASDGYLQVADWATWSNGASSWFETDGIHLTPSGVDALTSFIAATVDRVLAGEDVSPSAVAWTVLVPGDRGDAVDRVQAALVEAGIDLPGGIDGVYGNATMAAVAAYQRAQDELQVTGAVDLATARSLGVVDDDASAPAAADAGAAAGATPAPAPAAPSATPDPDRLEPASAPGSNGTWSLPWWLVAATVAFLSAVAAVALRRRQVVARRARRWARVHPATSPKQSVADLRRAGTLPHHPAADTATAQTRPTADADEVRSAT